MAGRPREAAVSTRIVVLGMERFDGTVAAEELYEVASGIGMSEQQVRLCLRRLVIEGHYVQHGRGRKAVFRATDRPVTSVVPEVEFLPFAYAQDDGDAPWDGVWRMLILTIAEAERQVRDQARARLAELGAAALGGGVYVSPHDLTGGPHDSTGHLRRLLDQIQASGRLATATTRDLSVAGERDPRRVAQLLWPVDTLAQAYQGLVVDVRARLRAVKRGRANSSAEGLTHLFSVVASLADVMSQDPLLPAELLPRSWAGARARAAAEELFAVLALRMQSDNPPRMLQWLPTLAGADGSPSAGRTGNGSPADLSVRDAPLT